MKSINPYTTEVIREYPEHTPSEVNNIINDVHKEWLQWRETSLETRAKLFRTAASLLFKKKKPMPASSQKRWARSSGNL